MNELQTIYSVEDVYLMLEVLAVDSHNRRLAQKAADRAAKEKGV